MDCNMPIMDGLEATTEIKKMVTRRELPDIKIVAATAYAFDSEIQDCYKAGMDDFISKPVDQGNLERVLKKYG